MTVVALSAERGVGKTTLAAPAAVALGAVHARVSGWLAHRLAEQGLDPTPEALRAAGEQAAADPSWLVQQVLTHHGWGSGMPLVFDAVRHREVLIALREQAAPQSVLHVALVLDPTQLESRLIGRGDAAGVAGGAGHSTERQVPTLVGGADLTLDAALSVGELVRRLEAGIQALR